MLGVLPCDCKMPRDCQRDMHVYGCIQRLAICAADSVVRKRHVPGGVHKTMRCCCMQSTLGAEVDVRRIGLWGTSFAGGHVLVTAAKEGSNISAVISQVCNLPNDALHNVKFRCTFTCWTRATAAVVTTHCGDHAVKDDMSLSMSAGATSEWD